MYTVAAFYKFVTINNIEELQDILQKFCKSSAIKGTILIAPEGINGTVAGTNEAIIQLFEMLRADTRFAQLTYKESFSQHMPFYRMKVRLKKEIITMKAPEANPNTQVGVYVDAKDWNKLLQDPDVVVLDTRNDYEVSLGTFKNAIDPKIQTFTQFKDFVTTQLNPEKHKKVAMFCTGGIRCEKASSYMMAHGFETVYHLDGGILKYLETIPQDQSIWQGECFVFDNRTAITHGLHQGHHELCHGCRYPISDNDKLSPKYEAGVTCPNCYDHADEAKLARARARQLQINLAKKQNKKHLGSPQ